MKGWGIGNIWKINNHRALSHTAVVGTFTTVIRRLLGAHILLFWNELLFSLGCYMAVTAVDGRSGGLLTAKYNKWRWPTPSASLTSVCAIYRSVCASFWYICTQTAHGKAHSINRLAACGENKCSGNVCKIIIYRMKPHMTVTGASGAVCGLIWPLKYDIYQKKRHKTAIL